MKKNVNSMQNFVISLPIVTSGGRPPKYLPTTRTSYTKSRRRPPEIPKVSQASTEIRNGDCQPRCQLAVSLTAIQYYTYSNYILIALLGQPNGSKIQNSASILGTHTYYYTHISFPPLCFLYSVDSFYRNKKLKELVEGGTHSSSTVYTYYSAIAQLHALLLF